jgi:RNA polymerase sigma-70 factor (ECF subfamily)
VRADAARLPSGHPDPGAAATRVASLFEAHGRMVYGLCRLLLRDATDAEDAAQQTFVSAYGALLRGSVVGDPPAWLAAAARNECRARLRRREREPVSLHQATVELLRSSAPDATHVLEGTALREALAELPLRQREAVVLRDVLGFRTREVGAMLGLSRPAVEALVFRARRRLRVRLRAAATVLAVPVALREGLAQALPGAVAPAGAAASGGVLAKLSGRSSPRSPSASPQPASPARVPSRSSTSWDDRRRRAVGPSQPHRPPMRRLGRVPSRVRGRRRRSPSNPRPRSAAPRALAAGPAMIVCGPLGTPVQAAETAPSRAPVPVRAPSLTIPAPTRGQARGARRTTRPPSPRMASAWRSSSRPRARAPAPGRATPRSSTTTAVGAAAGEARPAPAARPSRSRSPSRRVSRCPPSPP